MKRITRAFYYFAFFISLQLIYSSLFSQQYYLRNYSIEQGLAGISVTAILQDTRGYIWVGTEDGGVSKFDGKEFTSYRKKNGLGENLINCIFEDRDGNIWFGTESNGITKYDGQEFIQYNNGLKKADKIFSDSTGSILIYSYPNLYKLKGDSIVSASKNKDLQLQNFFRAGGPKAFKSIIDEHGNKWIATYSGLYLIKKEFADADDAFEHRILFPLSNEQPDEPATSLLQDREGNIWIGTAYHGLYVFVDGAFSNFNNIPSLNNEYITGITQTGNKYLIGTTKGIRQIEFNQAENKFNETAIPATNYISNSAITAIYNDGLQNIYMADENNNLLIFNGSLRQFRIPEIPDATIISSITKDKENNLWIATESNGIYVWNNKLITSYSANDSLISNQINYLYKDSDNNIWLATHGNGIQKFDGNKFTPYSYFENGLINDNISTITEGPDGLIWFGSEEGGVCSFNGQSFSHYSENDILSSNAVHSLIFDQNGNLWIGMASGVDKLIFNDSSGVSRKHYGEYDGFTGIKNNLSSIYSDADGHIWFGTVDGLFRYNPQEDFDIETKPLVELKDIRLFYEKADFSEYADTMMFWNHFPVNLKLPYNKNHLSFDFAALIFAIPEKINYQVMLEGFDDDWQQLGSNTSITYSNLPPRNYTFKVKAANAAGIWSEPATFSFTILKPFWATWAFRIAAAIIGIFIIWFIYYWRNKRLRNRAKQLELLIDQRTSELHQQKIKAEEAALRAEQSEKAKEEFLANISHEIRTPMNAIMGMTRLLIDKDPKETQKRYLRAIRQSSDNLLVIINDILDLSKIDAGKMELEQVPFILRNLLNNLEEIMKFKSDEKNLAFSIEIDGDIPECIIGDPVRLNQILINLTGNAIKFTESGYVKVICKLLKPENDRQLISFIVKDTGVGIASDKLAGIFESFSQADKATTRKFGGTGLGLSISKKLVDLAGGKIIAESELGKGSEFRVELPFETGDPALAIDNKQNVVVNDSVLQHDLQILLVEDNEFNQMVAIDSIESYFSNAKIDVAENGKIALEKLKEKNYSLILMDVQMPVMDGYETSREIRLLADKQKRLIPIVAMTASVIKSEVDKCYESGMTDFISKPFETEDLIQKISKYAQGN